MLSVPLLTNVTYQWKFNSNNIINGFTNQIIVRQSGTYSLSIQDVYGCASNSIPVIVTVNNNPIVNIITTDETITGIDNIASEYYVANYDTSRELLTTCIIGQLIQGEDSGKILITYEYEGLTIKNFIIYNKYFIVHIKF